MKVKNLVLRQFLAVLLLNTLILGCAPKRLNHSQISSQSTQPETIKNFENFFNASFPEDLRVETIMEDFSEKKNITPYNILSKLPKEFLDGFTLSFKPQGCSGNKKANYKNPRIIFHGNTSSVYGLGMSYWSHVPTHNKIEIIEFEPKSHYFKPKVILFNKEGTPIIQRDEKLAACYGCHTGKLKYGLNENFTITNKVLYAFRPNWENYKTWQRVFGGLFAAGRIQGSEDLEHQYLNEKLKEFKDDIPQDKIANDVRQLLNKDKLNLDSLAVMNKQLIDKIAARNSFRVANILVNSTNFESHYQKLFNFLMNDMVSESTSIGYKKHYIDDLKEHSKLKRNREELQDYVAAQVVEAILRGFFDRKLEDIEKEIIREATTNYLWNITPEQSLHLEKIGFTKKELLKLKSLAIVQIPGDRNDKESTLHLLAKSMLGDESELANSFHTLFYENLPEDLDFGLLPTGGKNFGEEVFYHFLSAIFRRHFTNENEINPELEAFSKVDINFFNPGTVTTLEVKGQKNSDFNVSYTFPTLNNTVLGDFSKRYFEKPQEYSGLIESSKSVLLESFQRKNLKSQM